MFKSRIATFAVLLFAFAVPAAEPPVIPVGYDAFRLWNQWPMQRIGARACMRSTYDRSGGNEGADASHFLYQLSDDMNVSLDIEGPGILYFTRYNHWHGSPWHYVVDGADHIVRETSTADPDHPAPGSVFIPTASFPEPLAFTWDATRGADLSWVPIGFANSFRLGYSRTRYGTGYYIYQQYIRGAKLSQKIKPWNETSPVPNDVIELLRRSGSDISPRSAAVQTGVLAAAAAGSTNILSLQANGPVMLRKLSLSIPRANALAFGSARLRITWDDRAEPSVDAPIALFFGAGILYNRDNREFLVKAFPVNVRYTSNRVELASYFPMPCFRSARIELIAPPDSAIFDVHWTIAREKLRAAPSQIGYFHATYRDHPQPEPGRDLVLLDTRNIEGGGDWSGNFIGTSWIFSDRANLTTLEGDPRFFFDDSRAPQAYGTGTEEWGGGGDYWGGLNMTLPFAGHPAGARDIKQAKSPEDQVESAYRFLLADLMPFGRNARIQLEHGGRDESKEHYQTIAYWYGAPAASLIKTDELKIGDNASEAAHDYHSPNASAPYTIASRYEWGADTVDPKGGTECYPAETDSGRTTTGASEFMVKLNPANLGVLLRRKLDYSFPNQRAEIFIADGKASPGNARWKPAGIWYLAGGNTCVYSNPKPELGPTQHIVQTSNRRFRDDEFLVPRDLTQGRSSIRIRVKFTPVNIPLFPGHPMPPLAWSEMRYDVYCYAMPDWTPK